jgi:hypothetical protein
MIRRAILAVWKVLREAEWLTPERARAYPRLLLVLTGMTMGGWIALSHGGLDRLGRPLGTDFLSFWAASKLALAGRSTAVYALASHAAAERSAYPGAPIGYAAFFYPPLYLLVCLPLALLPYLPALIAWLGATGYTCWRAVRGLLGEARAGLVAPILAFPGVFSTLVHGQNAFLTTALFGFGALCLETRPLLAGVMFGLLAFKPHLGLLVPIALIAGGRWKSVFAAAATVAAFAAVTTLVFGPDIWRAFAAISSLARSSLDQDLVGSEKMVSAFAAVRVLHGGVGLAYAVQAVVSVIAAILVAGLCRRRADPLAQGAALASASLLASPFLLDYDLMIAAVPLAWLVREARRTGFMPWEKTAILAAFILPPVARNLAGSLGLPVAPVVLMGLLAVVVRRGLWEGRTARSEASLPTPERAMPTLA